MKFLGDRILVSICQVELGESEPRQFESPLRQRAGIPIVGWDVEAKSVVVAFRKSSRLLALLERREVTTQDVCC